MDLAAGSTRKRTIIYIKLLSCHKKLSFSTLISMGPYVKMQSFSVAHHCILTDVNLLAKYFLYIPVLTIFGGGGALSSSSLSMVMTSGSGCFTTSISPVGETVMRAEKQIYFPKIHCFSLWEVKLLLMYEQYLRVIWNISVLSYSFKFH